MDVEWTGTRDVYTSIYQLQRGEKFYCNEACKRRFLKFTDATQSGFANIIVTMGTPVPM